jgi:hypothetical protein
MTRENRQICPVPGCGKNVARFGGENGHFAISHPDLDPNDFGLGLLPLAAPGAQQVVAPAAREPQQAGVDPGLAQAIQSMLSHVESQAQIIKEQQERLEALAKEQSAFQESVLKNFNDMPKMVDRSVTGHFDQLLAEAQARQAQGGNGQQETAVVTADGAPMTQQPQPGKRPDLLALFTQLAPLFLGQNKPADNIIGQLAMMKQIADVFNPLPGIMAGMQMMSTMITTSSRAGLSVDEMAKGGQKVIDGLGQSVKPPTIPPTGQAH